MEVARFREICTSLPLFPLPRTVLLPGAALPLHIFESRYRALVSHCLEGDRAMGIATLKPGYEANYHATPDVWPEIGVGEIVAHQPFPDGRCNIVLQYVGRARLQEELRTEHPFRVIRGDAVEEDERGLGPKLPSSEELTLELLEQAQRVSDRPLVLHNR